MVERDSHRKIERYLEEIGFEIFSFERGHFVDKKNKMYGAWGDISQDRRLEEVKGGQNSYETIAGVRKINPEEDVYNVLAQDSQCRMGTMQYWGDINFLNGMCPSTSHYNAVVISPGASWGEDGMDGGRGKTLYSLLMLKSNIEKREKFIRNLTAKEKADAAMYEDDIAF